MENLLFPLLILLLFIPIFLSGRKQRRQMKDMQALQASIEPGDVVVTTSGLRATVVDASYEETIDLEIADGIVTTWVRAAVREKVNPTPDDASALTAHDHSHDHADHGHSHDHADPDHGHGHGHGDHGDHGHDHGHDHGGHGGHDHSDQGDHDHSHDHSDHDHSERAGDPDPADDARTNGTPGSRT